MKKLTDIKKDFPQWYQDVIYQAELVDSSPTPGCFVICPYGYAIWEEIQKNLDARIKKLGAKNAYFPLLIPESFLKKEAEHVEGFAPEVAVVTHAGGKKLEEPFVIRPTSETMMYHMFAKWITSWRDLPLKINQWANVVRWEMRPRAFLRTREFLWHEGHTAHATRDEAVKMAEQEIAMYKDFVENVLAIPVIPGVKSASERFAGAEETYCIEALMQDGKALQFGTSHLLAHSFPKSFGLEFQDKDGNVKVPYCTSFGVATRMIGGIVMQHGDENGLIIPPNVAPIQVVIVPIFRKDEEKEKVLIMPFTSDNFIHHWQLWKNYRKEMGKKKYQIIGEQSALSSLSKKSDGNENTAVNIINQSMANGWLGFFELKQKNDHGTTTDLLKRTLQRIRS